MKITYRFLLPFLRDDDTAPPPLPALNPPAENMGGFPAGAVPPKFGNPKERTADEPGIFDDFSFPGVFSASASAAPMMDWDASSEACPYLVTLGTAEVSRYPAGGAACTCDDTLNRRDSLSVSLLKYVVKKAYLFSSLSARAVSQRRVPSAA